MNMRKISFVLLALLFTIIVACAAMADDTNEMNTLFSRIASEEIPSYRKGGLVIHGKMIVGIRYDESSAFEVLTKENNITADGLVFPDDRLAESYEEADAAVFIYPSYGQMGFYTGGGTGYKTYTMVKHVDLKTMRAYHETVCTQEPPRAVTGNVGTDRYGRFMPDTAIQRIVERADSLVPLGHYADELIYWRVLDETETTVTLITDKGLDCVCFNETRRDENLWETSSIRGWLNGEFVHTAFSAEELAKIMPDSSGDLVRMLTEDEARAFFAEKEDRMLLPSAAALAHDAYIDEYDGTCGWWLTTQGEQNDKVMYVQRSGAIGSWYVWVNNVVVRPVITLKKNDQ